MPRNRPTPTRRLATTVAVVLALGTMLAGCTTATPTPVASATSVAPTAGASGVPTAAPTFGATASTPVARTHFDAVVQNLLKTDPQPHGRDVIDALVAGGFAKSAMQLTPDQTTTGRASDSIEFSVLWRSKDCLVGQVGAGGYGSTSAPVLGTGRCLVGTTRAIDW